MNPARVLLAIITACLAAGATQAGVPSPSNSSVPTCLVACPLGDIPYTVVVRDLASNPLGGAQVTIDYSNCPQVAVCAFGKNPSYTVDFASRRVHALTNAAGTVTFPLRAGGLCASDIRIFADGVLLAVTRMASPDQDHDLVVLGPDYLLFAPKLGTVDLTGDFDCNGLVDQEDQDIGGQHGSHSCYGIVNPVNQRTWGGVKSFYR